MKLAAALISILILSACETIPIRAKVCYHTPDGSVCVGSDGKGIIVEGSVGK